MVQADVHRLLVQAVDPEDHTEVVVRDRNALPDELLGALLAPVDLLLGDVGPGPLAGPDQVSERAVLEVGDDGVEHVLVADPAGPGGVEWHDREGLPYAALLGVGCVEKGSELLLKCR